MNWNAEQRRLLAALGHDLMVHGRVWPAPPAAGEMPAQAAMRANDEAPRGASASVQTARLLEALCRAAGGADVASLVGDIDRLRKEPARKRALWPQLRALRRSH